MILYRWQGSVPNFGDELNTVLWPRLLPGFFDDNPNIRFLGIGSVLDSRHPAAPLKIVAGSGYGGYEQKPALDHRWMLHWVRGPRTAAALGMPSGLALGDPAMLLPLALRPPVTAGHADQIGFMPHFESMGRGAWHQVAARTGVTLIDPRDPPLLVVDAIRRCKLLLSEALHGVIVADALRVPWIAMRPLAAIHRPKWADWSDVIEMPIRACVLPASLTSELVSNWGTAAPRPVRAWLDRQGRHLDRFGSERPVSQAAEAVRRAAMTEPQLSPPAVLDRCQTRMMHALHALQRQPVLRRGFRSEAATRSALRSQHNSAYQLHPTG